MTRLLAVAVLSWIASAPLARAVDPVDTMPSAQLDSPRGKALFAERCAMCHEHPSGNIPPVFVLNYKSPEQIVLALTSGPMRQQAAGLNADDIRALAIHLAHRAPGEFRDPDPSANRCAHAAGPLAQGESSWNGVGGDTANTRYQGMPGIAAADVPRLRVKWSFAYPGGAAYGAPVVVGDRLFVTTATGRIFALDAKSGCTYWSWQAEAPIRAAVSIGLPPSAGTAAAAYFGDEKGFVYAVDAERGKLLWRTKADDHPLVRITGSPTLYRDTLYVPVSAMDEGAEWDRSHPCCTFRGSVVAMDAATGRIRWKTYMVPRPAVPLGRTNEAGTPLFGPAGAAIWSAPTIDPRRKLVYVATGNAYNDAEEGDTNAVVALDLATGERHWAVQPLPDDDPYTGCKRAKRADCEKPAPEYLEFGDSPVLRDLPNGNSVLVVGQKSGVVYALDPDRDGTIIWQARIGEGGPLGGVMYGAAADRIAAYVSVADRDAKPPFAPGGLSALALGDGKQLWHAAPPAPICAWGKNDCSAAQPGAATAIPGVVFSGSLDGHIRGFSATDGKIVWDFDTARNFDAANGVRASGGSVNGYPQIVANGILYVISGGSLLTHPGNVLIAFSVDGK
ncbi:MAG TPA: PQQ-binding-like beta-propeller repeat protein [Alphaproteobacteria bacterium]|nr:PQQ-binding-like beta-propeller repeat protein [Alphaproteobacteria bacterium]